MRPVAKFVLDRDDRTARIEDAEVELVSHHIAARQLVLVGAEAS
jgi:hypothetical protein